MKNRVEEIVTNHHFIGGVYAKEMKYPLGWIIKSHKHKYDHMSILSQGSVVLEVEGVKEVFEAPAVISVKAHKTHSVLALEVVVWFCIHKIEGEFDIDTVDETLIEEEK